MAEFTVFNDWFYGTSYDSLSTTKINIGAFDPSAVRTLLENSQIELIIFRVRVSDKERLMRQLNREENPNCAEIARRFLADKQDFKDIDFPTVEIMNNSLTDLDSAIGLMLGQLTLNS